MPCFHPIPAFQDRSGGPVRLYPPLGTACLYLPCGGCVGCRQVRANEWAARCVHEASLYERNCFVTLTYDVPSEPEGGFLLASDLQKFFKRLRKRVYSSVGGAGFLFDSRFPIRYFACGEYGSIRGRPHYHALIFNLSFSDGVRCGSDLFQSDTLSSLWPFGLSTFGAVTSKSAQYVAGYSLKSQRVPPVSEWGEVPPRPFLRMSRKPAVGAGWLSLFQEDLRNGFLVHDGVLLPVPRAYMVRLERDSPGLFQEVLVRRQSFLVDHPVAVSDAVAAEAILKARRALFLSPTL